MSVFGVPPPSRSSFLGAHTVLQRLRTESGRLRSRLALGNLVSFLTFLTLGLVWGDDLGATAAGWLTFGLVLLGFQLCVVLVSVVWYDRACVARCDPYVEALREAAGASPTQGVKR